jgi:AcrR family transcriptional regulator
MDPAHVARERRRGEPGGSEDLEGVAGRGRLGGDLARGQTGAVGEEYTMYIYTVYQMAITRQQVLDATLGLAAEEGLDAVTMRAVARRLGVTPMALYRHVGDKQGLLDGLVERLLEELPEPDPALPWQERLDRLGAGMRAAARRYPDVFPLLLRRPATTPEAKRRRAIAYQALEDAGVPEDLVPRVERLLSSLMIGFAASEAGGRFRGHSRKTLDEDLAWLQSLAASQRTG